MSSSTSSSDWRRFFRLAVGTAVLVAAVVYAFVVLVDPFDTLPLSPPANRVPVATDARFAFPALARSKKFDSAIVGTSTSRLLRPVVLNRQFDARFVNLSMNDATPYEQSRLFALFAHAHPDARVVMFGLDVKWCRTGDSYPKFTPRPFPMWMYRKDPWRGYAEMFNLYAVQEAGQQFGILAGIKTQVYGSDGYTSFVPPDSEYDPARVAMHLREEPEEFPLGPHNGPAESWRYPALEDLRADLAMVPRSTRKVLFFVPYNHVMQSPPGSPGAAAWNECKRRAAAMPDTLVVDFMIPSPITDDDNNYWDGMHYRAGIADRLARDLAAAVRGEGSADYRIIPPNAEPAS